MILLDTDHLTVLQMGLGERYLRLIARIAQTPENVTTSIVNIEELMRGWLSAIAKERQVERQVRAYNELNNLFRRFSRFDVLEFNESAVQVYPQLRTGRGNLGQYDLKIASIAIAHNALLLTANRRDFEQVPGLRFENWIDA